MVKLSLFPVLFKKKLLEDTEKVFFFKFSFLFLVKILKYAGQAVLALWSSGLSPSLHKFLSQDIVQSTTIKNTFVGTAEWMAPEAIACKNQTKPADIWSLGCTILEMTYADTPWSRNMEERRNGVFSALGMPFHWHTPKRLVGLCVIFFISAATKTWN